MHITDFPPRSQSQCFFFYYLALFHVTQLGRNLCPLLLAQKRRSDIYTFTHTLQSRCFLSYTIHNVYGATHGVLNKARSQ